MINLLPPKQADAIRYARQNTALRVWLIGLSAAIVGLAIILSAGWVYLNQESKNLQKNIDVTNQQLQAQNLAKVKADAKEITGDITVINRVVSQEVRFSDLIETIGKDMPPGTVLGSLSLGKVSGAVDLTASAKDYSSAAQIALNLSDPKNDLFSKVDIVSVSCNSSSTQVYKCGAILKALFNATAKTKFLSVPKAGSS
jgi:Tfp pilus assembly protein PilN